MSAPVVENGVWRSKECCLRGVSGKSPHENYIVKVTGNTLKYPLFARQNPILGHDGRAWRGAALRKDAPHES